MAPYLKIHHGFKLSNTCETSASVPMHVRNQYETHLEVFVLHGQVIRDGEGAGDMLINRVSKKEEN